MSRIRTIKPEFFIHDGLAELSPLHRLLFIGLWTMADREGRLEDRPKRVKAALLPYDEADVGAMLTDLQVGGFIERYEVVGEGGEVVGEYIQVRNFLKHQHINIKEGASIIPAPDSHGARTVKALDEHAGREGKGREGKEKHLRVAFSDAARGEDEPSDRSKTKDEDQDEDQNLVLDLDLGQDEDEALSLEEIKSRRKAKAKKAGKETNPRHAVTVRFLVAVWEETHGGVKYLPFTGRDAKAVEQLLGFPDATDEEIERRARHAFTDPYKGGGMRIPKFVEEWAVWAVSREEAKARGSSSNGNGHRTGSVRAEDMSHPATPGYVDLLTGEVTPLGEKA